MSLRKILKSISVHPAEADSIADAFGRGIGVSRAALDRLEQIDATLAQEWEGRQQAGFAGELEGTIRRIRQIQLPTLETAQTKLRAFRAEKIIEEWISV